MRKKRKTNAVLQRLVNERQQAQDNIDAILEAAEDEERDPSESERNLITRHRERIEELDPQIEELLEVEESRQRSAEQREQLLRAAPPGDGDGDPPAEDDGGGERPVYRTFAQYARDALICRVDRIAAIVEPELRHRAAQRLERAQVHTTTTDVAGLVMPQHLAQIFEVIDKARPVVSSSRQIGLTSGKIEWPSIQARPTVAKQAAEKTEAAYSKMTVSMKQDVADTFLGAGNLSWQTIQWSSPDALSLFFDLMAEAYAEQTEADACATVDAGATAGPTVATNDLAGWMAAIAEAAGVVRAACKARVNTIYMDPATAYGVLGMVAVAAPVFLTAGSGSLGDASGNLGGLRFVASDGFPADTAIVGDSTKLLCAETSGAPVEMRAVEPSIGGLEVGVIGAFASVVALPGAFTQLVKPTVP